MAVRDIDAIAAHSFCDFHTKGLDYLCLQRSPELTRKVYFFDGDLDKLPEVVLPHDHRYAFLSTVLSGRIANRLFTEDPQRGTQVYERFDYLTPLNGGAGFTWTQTARLAPTQVDEYTRGQSYGLQADQIHTLSILSDRSVLMVDQYADVVPIGQPTRAYRPDGYREGPSLSGLYRRMTPDEVVRRLGMLDELTESG